MPTDTLPDTEAIRQEIDADFAELVELVRMAKAAQDPGCRQAHLIAVEYALRDYGLPRLMKTVLRRAELEADKRPISGDPRDAVQESLDRRSS